VAFRYVKPGASDDDLDAINRRISERVAADGCCFASTTVIRGRTVLRLCTIHPATTEDDIRAQSPVSSGRQANRRQSL
jgi:hypothetical protein